LVATATVQPEMVTGTSSRGTALAFVRKSSALQFETYSAEDIDTSVEDR